MIKRLIRYILSLFGLTIKENNNNTNNINNIVYEKKYIMTQTEIKFYQQFKEIIGDKYIIWPQINLATVICSRYKNGYNKRMFQNDLYRNIDFGIFDRNTYELLLLIEINDESHNNNPKTIARDKKVKNICYRCGYKIISFWLNKPNAPKHLRERILSNLGELDSKFENTMEFYRIVDDRKEDQNHLNTL